MQGKKNVSWIPAYTEYVHQHIPNEIKLITKNFPLTFYLWSSVKSGIQYSYVKFKNKIKLKKKNRRDLRDKSFVAVTSFWLRKLKPNSLGYV